MGDTERAKSISREVTKETRKERPFPPTPAEFPDFPGQFDGVSFHSHKYLDPFELIDMRGKRVLVVGMGNSAMDIASELSQRLIAKSWGGGSSARWGCCVSLSLVTPIAALPGSVYPAALLSACRSDT